MPDLTGRPRLSGDTRIEDVFTRIATDYLAYGRGASAPFGQAAAFRFDGRDLVDFGVAWLERYGGGAPAGSSGQA